MSDTSKWAIGLLSWLVLTVSTYFIFGICAHGRLIEKSTTTPLPPINNSKRSAIDFRFSDATPFINEGYEAYKTKILSEATTDNILTITGYYIKGEDNNSTMVNIGLARAHQLRKLLKNELHEDRIRLSSKRMPAAPSSGVNQYFNALSYKWTPKPKPRVEVLSDRIIIRFPFNSIEKEGDKEIDQYLNKLAKRVKESKEKVSLTGHTDNIGEAEANFKIGLRRAKMIRDILIQKGVNRNQISTHSKGIEEPIFTNETEEGRNKNRRVVLRITEK